MSSRTHLKQIVDSLNDAEIELLLDAILFHRLKPILHPLVALLQNGTYASQSDLEDPVQVMKYTYHGGSFLAWASEVVDTMSEGISLLSEHIPLPEEELLKSRFHIRHRLSALVDRGRWFLPNQDDGMYGQEKESAYRGFRQPALSCIVEAFSSIPLEAIHDVTKLAQYRTGLLSAKRAFVSNIHDILLH